MLKPSLSCTAFSVAPQYSQGIAPINQSTGNPNRRPMQHSPVTVVIPAYKNRVLLEACVNSVLSADSECLESIVLINDCSPEPDVTEYCRTLAREQKIQLLENTENGGFVQAVNQGMAASSNDIVLLNSDTLVSEGWLEKINKTAAKHPDAATITPFTNNGTICSYPNFCENNALPDGLSLRDLSALVSKINEGAVCELPTAVGFCMYIRRRTIDELGGFDAKAYGRGYGEENDFCMRATAAGWRHLLAADVFVFHEGGVSFGNEATALQRQAMEVLEQRYPDYRTVIAEFIALDPVRPFRDRIDDARLSVEGQASVLLEEARNRLNAKVEAQNKTEVLLTHQLQTARDYGAEQSAQLQALEKEMESLKAYAESRASEAGEYATRIQQHEATLQQLGESVRSMTERIQQYDLRVEQYEALLADARKAYQESEDSKLELITSNSVLSSENRTLRSMLSVRIQHKLMKLMGKR